MFSNAPDSAVRSFIYSSVLWLIVGGSALSLSAAKLISPDLLSTEVLSFGRLRAAASLALIYGWLTQVSLAAILFIIPRLTGARLKTERNAQLAGMLINTALFLGVSVSLLGGVSGREFMELPIWMGAALVAALALVALTVVRTVASRIEEKLYSSAWFLIGAAIWAPLSLAAGTLPRFRGSPASIAHLFSLSSYLLLFLGGTAIGSILYLIPRTTGKPLYSQRLAMIGFGSLALAGPLSSQSRAIFGPAPDWLETVSVAASIALLITVWATVVTVLGSLRGAWDRVPDHPSIKFLIGGLAVFSAALLQGVVQSFRSTAQTIGMTDWISGQIWLLVIGMSLTGAGVITFAFPRLIGRRWFDRTQITAHFWATVGAAVLIALGAWGSGIASGILWQTDGGFAAALQAAKPYRVMFFAGTALFFIGQGVFVLNLLRSTTRGEPRPIEIVAPAEVDF